MSSHGKRSPYWEAVLMSAVILVAGYAEAAERAANGMGAVTERVTNAENIEYTVATLGEGQVFGEMALLTGEPRSANVKTITEVRAIEVRQQEFTELIRIN